MTPAERSRRYRRRKRLGVSARPSVSVVVPVADPASAALRHGAWAQDVDDAVGERLADPALPDYIRLPVFRPAAAAVLRRVERAERVARWLATLSEEEASTPRRAGSSSPEEISRHLDDSALRGLASLGLTPQSMARFGRMLEERQKPDLALLAAEGRLEEFAAEQGDAG